MEATGTYVSLSRSKLGPEPETKHALRYVHAEGSRSRAFCTCGWSRKRAVPWIAREAVEAHIAAANAAAVARPA